MTLLLGRLVRIGKCIQQDNGSTPLVIIRKRVLNSQMGVIRDGPESMRYWLLIRFESGSDYNVTIRKRMTGQTLCMKKTTHYDKGSEKTV